MKILSVLMATTHDRVNMFTDLYNELNRQHEYMQTFHPSLGEIEILVDSSKRYLDGGLSIGKKRQALVQRAEGIYCAFLDSDEQIAGNYLETVVRLCQSNSDVITFRSLANLDSYWCLVDMSLGHKENEQLNPNIIAKRRAWHVCPVKTEIAKRYEFEDINYGEDWKWFEKVLQDCTCEAKTNAIIHMYKHRMAISEADRITRYEKETTI